MDLFLIHCILLVWLSIGSARKLVAHIADRLLTAALLFWGNIVTTSLLLSLTHQLGETWWFLGTSLLLAGLLGLLLIKVRPKLDVALEEPAKARINGWLLTTFIATLVPIALANLAVGYTYQPNNPDALSWQLPRALYYLGQNNLAHFDALDLRQTHLPFNYNLLQLFGLIYSPPLQCLNLFNLIAWAAGGIAVYRLCRLSAIGINSSLITCWLVLTTTPVVAQATSTTTELPAGAALLCAVIYGLQWLQGRQSRLAVLLGLALGLATGSNLNLLICSFASVLFFIGRGYRSLQTSRRVWAGAGWLVLVLVAPFALINFAKNPGWIGTYFRFAADLPPTDIVSLAWQGLWPLPMQPAPLFLLNEDNVGFGFTGPLFLVGAVCCLLRPRTPAVWLAWMGFGWFLIIACLGWSEPSNPGDFVPVLMLLGPAMAALIESSRIGRGLALVVALATVWSSTVYLLRNSSRPLMPLLNAAFTPPALPTLPLLMEHRLKSQSRINIDTDGINERIFPFLIQGHGMNVTSRHLPFPDAYNLLSRSTLSRNAAFVNLARQPAYTLIPIPSKHTAGIEFLATIGRGPDARDYFGLEPAAGQTPPINSNRSLLVSLYRENDAATGVENTRIRVAGLNPEDQARLDVEAEHENDSIVHLASITANGDTVLSIQSPFRQLAFRVHDATSGAEIGATVIPFLPQTAVPSKPIDPSLPTSTRSIFVTDIVLSRDNPLIKVDSLLPVEGPFPQWDLPYLRWQRVPSTRITIPPVDQLAHLQLSFSVRLHVRKKAALDVLFNGQLVERYRIEDPTIWVDKTLELTPQRGENVLEFRDAPLNNEPDWLDYLERYPDVKKHLTLNHIPLEAGAQDHYEVLGKKEGRTIQFIAKPEPAPDGYYFMYRNIRLEGFKKP